MYLERSDVKAIQERKFYDRSPISNLRTGLYRLFSGVINRQGEKLWTVCLYAISGKLLFCFAILLVG